MSDVVSLTAAGVVVMLSVNGTVNYGSPVVYPAGATPVALAVGDFNRDGQADVVTANAAGNDVTILFGAGDGTLGSPVHIAAGSSPSAIAVVDLNRDGRTDLIVADEGSGQVSVLLGKGDGTFQAPVAFSAGSSPSALTLSDFNRDGFLDVATVASAGGAVTVLLGDGKGGFPKSHVASSGANSSISLAAADFNGDGFPDIAVAEGNLNSQSTGVVYLCQGNGDGTFQAPTFLALPQYSPVIAAGDVNGDGHPDLLATLINEVGINNINALAVLINKGSGTFASPELEGTAENPGALAAVDLNHDGKLDVVVGCGPDVYSGQGYVTVIVGRGTVSLAEVQEIRASGALAVDAADINGDGHVDVLVGTTTGITPYFGNGEGGFTPGTVVPVSGGGVANLAVADVNGDHKLDLVAFLENGNLAVALGHGDGTFGAAASYPGYLAYGFAVGDLNGDGYADVALSAIFSNGVQILWGSATGALVRGPLLITSYAPAQATQAVAIGEFNGDGLPDLAVSTVDYNTLNNYIELFPGKTDGTLGSSIKTLVPVNGSIAAADMNRDGRMDLVLSGVEDINIQTSTGVLLSNGDGTFHPETFRSSPYWTGAITVADLNGDGNPDVAVIPIDPQLVIFTGDGAGNLSPGPIYGAGVGAWTNLVHGDFLGDGKPGLTFANALVGTFSVVENTSK